MNVMNYDKCGDRLVKWEYSKSSYPANRTYSDATTNLCKSVKSVSFYIFRHRLTMINTILPKVSTNKT
ncbi:MAG: hypothetical protein C5S43_01405 [Candidatus Methanocomedens sp.]|nr:MAG: hypothetical protein C5S43_01405 [ANME-2 cluster archaeon]